MGFLCNLNKEEESDHHGKTFTEPSTHTDVRMRRMRKLFDRVLGRTAKDLSTMDAPKTAELKLQFQEALTERGTPKEHHANRHILDARHKDLAIFSAKGRDAAGHFSRNALLIDLTQLLPFAQQMPKGAHLHIHFNSTLLPEVLLGYAKQMYNMCIWSVDRPLRTKEDFDNCEIQFSLVPREEIKEDGIGPNLFVEDYKPEARMRYQYFRHMWEREQQSRTRASSSDLWPMNMECDDWLISKLVFGEEEISALFSQTSADPPANRTDLEATAEAEQATQAGYPADIVDRIRDSPYRGVRERAAKAWTKFNGRTRMMKGLFNYEVAFRAYTRRCLEEFVRDNVQYAEIRPNFMETNQIIQNDGSKMDNYKTMEIIIEEYERFMKDIGDMTADGQIKENRFLQGGKPVYNDNIPKGNGHRASFGGLKVIYCTPRSFSKEKIRASLAECLKFKIQWPSYIAGFDLVGEEAYDKPYPLDFFKEEFTQFQKDCAEATYKDNTPVGDIPFLFHCGETPDDQEGNLECALELGSKRIGHGYALPKKPKVMKEMKRKDVCVETCPISNMVLGLTENMGKHRVYDLLANGVHCAVSSDNGTLFRSTLSHDFYEVMVGNRNMNLFGWRQLARWSIDHSCMGQDERERVLVEWQYRWEEFTANAHKRSTGREPERLKKLEEAKRQEEARAASRMDEQKAAEP